MERNVAVLRLASWIGKQGRGSAVLKFAGHQLVLHVNEGQITAVEGPDGEILAAAFGLPPEGEWFAEARAAASQGLVTPEEAAAVLKRAVVAQLVAFFKDPKAGVEILPGEPKPASGFVISYPHIVYELVLSAGGEELVGLFLPDTSAVLRRLPAFSQRVKELNLPDEALAILAKINDARSAEAIAEPSPHGRETVLRLLAATVGAGLVELQQPSVEEVPLEKVGLVARSEPRRRRWLWGLILAAVMLGGVAFAVFFRGGIASNTSGNGLWAVAVGGACQPGELEQLYRLQAKGRGSLRVVPFGGGLEKCYRLVWGAFATREQAEAALGEVPKELLQPAFTPHVLLVEANTP
ncbi:MAG: hypothetical protein ACUVRY_04900 [Thermoanaerobaculaceae bacterium]